jgi:hypothetical protein
MTSLKAAFSVLSLSCLLAACAHRPQQPSVSPHTVSGANLKARVVGEWWFDDYNPAGHFYLVTFYPDGRFRSSNPYKPGVERDGFWRVTADDTLLVTRTKDALPDSSEEIFALDHMTDTEMVFGHPSVAGRMTFRKVTPETAPEPAGP